jgi:methyl-accepting chemotaxis protein
MLGVRPKLRLSEEPRTHMRTLRAKLISLCVLTSTAVLAVLGSFQYVWEKQRLTATLEASMDAAAVRLASNLVDPVWNVFKDQTLHVLENELANPDIVAIVVKDEDGAPIEAASRLDGKVAELSVTSTIPVGLLSRTFVVQRERKTIAKGELLYTLDALHAQLRIQAGMTLLSILAVAGCMGAVLLLVLSRLVLGPMNRVALEAVRLRDAVRRGELDDRAEVESVAVEFRPALQGMNEVMDEFVRPFRTITVAMDRISRGDIPPPLADAHSGEFQRTQEAVNRSMTAVRLLVEDAARLAEGAIAGDLSVRAEPAHHQGDFRRIIAGVNGTLDAVIAPLQAAARCVDAISRGAIPPPIADAYRGEFDQLKASLNRCIQAVHLLADDAATLARSAAEGQLSVRADAARHQGDFRKIIEDFNATLDAVIGPVQLAVRCVDDISKGTLPPDISAPFAGDLRPLKESLNRCIAAVHLLVNDTASLAESAVAGQLSARADAGRHQGDFRRIVDGINHALEAITEPVKESSDVLGQLAERDLRARVTKSYNGDHARMKASVNATAQALHDALRQVSYAVEQVSSASTQIASSSQSVASGASQQAASLEETTASITSVTEMTRQTADSAQAASALAQAARSAAGEGGTAVEQLHGAMSKIKASAEGTSQIIRDINDIAFQTNLLALNAAVEAARAGDAGRGFAVVAEEVRSLALRAKEAASRTEELIRQSVGQTVHGESAAKAVAGKLSEIASGIGKVTDLVSEIAAAAREQAAGIEQVNRALGEMDKLTQQNAASAEESSSAASELSGQAEELAAMLGAFRLEEHGGRGPGGSSPLGDPYRKMFAASPDRVARARSRLVDP